jgi:transcriptional regulator with XRE-family HTH domain
LFRKIPPRKNPKEAHSCPLNDLLWERVGEILSKSGQSFPDLWALVKRDKNTYTNWINKRTIPKVSDLQELASALGRTPADLLSWPRHGDESISDQQQQLDLPFGVGAKSVQFELQYTISGLLLKKIGKTA